MRIIRCFSLLFCTLIFAKFSNAQSFGIGTDNPDPQAIMELSSTTQGFLAPRMTTGQRDAIGVLNGQDDGLLIYNLSTDQFNYWDGTQWVIMPDLSSDNDWTRGTDVMYPSNINDDIGIGTTTPTHKLDISHNSSVSNAHIRLNEIGNDYARITFNNTNYPSQYWSLAAYPNSTSSLAQLNLWFHDGTVGNDWFSFRGNGRAQFGASIDASGTPGSGVLEIGGSLRIDNNEIITNTDNPIFLQYGNNGDLSIDYPTFFVDASENNVGIGDVTPNHKLDIYHNSNTTNSHLRLNEVGTDYARLNFSNTTYPTAFWTIAGLSSTTSANGLMNFYFNNGTTGNNWLSIYGDGRIEMPYTGDASDAVNTGVLEIANSLRFDGNEIITNTNTPLYIQNDNNGDLAVDGSTFRVDASADFVGIGDITPNAKLDVEVFTTNQAIYAYSSAGEGARIRGDGVDPGGGWWFSTGATGGATNFAGPAGVIAGGRGGGVYGMGYIDADATTDHAGGVFGSWNGSSWFGLSAVGSYINGTSFKIVGLGTVSTLVKDDKDVYRIMHATETPEALFEDFGESQLINGIAHIKLDPIFSRNIVVNEEHALRVFIQLNDDCNGTFVTNRSVEGFTVKELRGGKSNAKFTWSVTANRKNEKIDEHNISNYEGLRFEPIQEPKHIYHYSKDESLPPKKADLLEEQGY